MAMHVSIIATKPIPTTGKAICNSSISLSENETYMKFNNNNSNQNNKLIIPK